jgi:hypothetical protein
LMLQMAPDYDNLPLIQKVEAFQVHCIPLHFTCYSSLTQ